MIVALLYRHYRGLMSIGIKRLFLWKPQRAMTQDRGAKHSIPRLASQPGQVKVELGEETALTLSPSIAWRGTGW